MHMRISKRFVIISLFLLMPLVSYAIDAQLYNNFLGDSQGMSPQMFKYENDILAEIFDALMQYAFLGMMFLPMVFDEDEKKKTKVINNYGELGNNSNIWHS